MPLDPNPDVAELMEYSGVRRPPPPPPALPVFDREPTYEPEPDRAGAIIAVVTILMVVVAVMAIGSLVWS
jgi:hypothetical protein